VEGVVGAIVVVGEGERAHGCVVRAIEEYRDLREGFRSPMRSQTVR
jgi:hypothetical protein